MAKNKKRKRKGPSRSYAQPKHWYDRTMTAKQQVIAYVTIAIVFILLALAVIFILGHNADASQGYDTSDEAIQGYFRGIKNNDAFELQRCYDLHSVNGSSDCKKQQQLAQQLAATMQIDLDTIRVNGMDYSGDIEDLQRNTKNHAITEACQSRVTFMTKETKSDSKDTVYTRFHVQRFITYKASEKWYIYTNSESLATTLEAADKRGNPLTFATGNIDLETAKQAGDDTYGHIKIGSDWTQVDSVIDGEIAYENANSTARIALAIVEGGEYDGASMFAAVFEQSLQQSDNFRASICVRQTRFANNDAYLVTCMDEESGQLFFAWIFNHPNRDDCICNVSFECMPSAADAAAYVSTFAF